MSRLRLLRKYPFADIVDDKETYKGREVLRYRNETSLLQTIDLSSADDTIRRAFDKTFEPQQVSYLSAEETKTDNVFETLNPITSRYAYDRCLRQQIVDELSAQLNAKLKEEEDKKAKDELKAKYDKFIESLG